MNDTFKTGLEIAEEAIGHERAGKLDRALSDICRDNSDYVFGWWTFQGAPPTLQAYRECAQWAVDKYGEKWQPLVDALK